MSVQPGRAEQFYDSTGIQASLRCYGDRYCTLDISVPTGTQESGPGEVILEVLWQPRDSSTHLPRGVPLRLLREPLRLMALPGQRRAVARSVLPGVDATLAPDCYYRVRRSPDVNPCTP